MKKDEPIKRFRANNEEIAALFNLAGIIQALAKAIPTLERRCKATPYAWRDIKMVHKRLDYILTEIVKTYPLDKLAGVLPQYKNAILEVYMRKPVIPNKNYVTLESDDFETICRYAFEGNCKMCIDGNCNKCELGKQFDRHMVTDRDGGDWSTIGIDGV